MGKPIKVPNPVYERVSAVAERDDVSRGVVVMDWMEKAERFEEIEQGRY